MRQSVPRKLARSILVDYVESGRLHQGDRLPPVRDLEKQYETSRSSVVSAISLLEQEGWLERRHGIGCFVAQTQGADSLGKQELIGFLGTNNKSELMLRVYEGVERVSRIHGFHVLVASSNQDYATEQWQLRRMIEAGCQTVVILPVTRTLQQLQTDYLRDEFRDFPIVLIDLAYPEQGHLQVVFDNYAAGYDLTEMLLHAGHKRIAFMGMERNANPLMHYSTCERYRGYLDALRVACVPARPEDYWDVCRLTVDMNDIHRFLVTWRNQPERATAVIAWHDEAAILTIQHARELGIAVPEELRVVGFDNLMTGRAFSPLFSTTDPDFRRAGELATRLAIARIRGVQKTPVIYMLPAPILRPKGESASHRTVTMPSHVLTP